MLQSAGLLTCKFKPKNSPVEIFHSASKTLDIAVLPNIDIISDPQFPHCKSSSTEEVVVAVVDPGVVPGAGGAEVPIHCTVLYCTLYAVLHLYTMEGVRHR